MRRTSTSIAVVLSILLFVFTCSAQQTATTAVPNLMRYGGTLNDANGAPIAAANGVTFAIYKQQDGGAPVWMETQNVIPDASGQYSVLLGSTTATGLPSDLFSQEEQRWLGVQVQGQSEQPRVLLVSVPYAFKAHEAETLAGKSISDFVLAKDLNATNSAAGIASTAGSSPGQKSSGKGNSKSPSDSQPSMGQTFFSSSLTPVVSVMQTGTTAGNNAVLATNSNLTSTSNAVTGQIAGAGRAIYGQALSTSAQAYGVQGDTASTIGVGLLGFATATTGSTYGLKGYSSSTGGTGVRGLSTANTGFTYGVSGAVSSPNGTAMWGQATASNGGTGVWGQSQATTGTAVGVLATAASNAGTGIVATESATTGTTYGLNAAVQSSNGTAAWLQNTAGGPLILATTGPSTSPVTKFSVDGNGNVTVVGVLSGNAINTAAMYQIDGSGVVSIGNSDDKDLFLGVGSGTNDVAGFGIYNTFSGYQSGYSNTSGMVNTFSGYRTGYSNTTGSYNTFSGVGAGYFNTTGSSNTFSGASAGYYNTTGSSNTFSGSEAGINNTTGTYNTFSGYQSGSVNTTGSSNTFSGVTSGYYNTTGASNTFLGAFAGYSNTTGSYNIFSGVTSGYYNTTGIANTFSGYLAGHNNTTGSYNSFDGWQAGESNTTGSNNIYMGNRGPVSGAENNTIRIGTQGTGTGQQNVTFIAGIYGGTTNGGQAVFVDSTGQLGTGGGGGGLVLTSVIQNYTSSTDITCPSGYTAVLASCQAGVNVVLNDANSPIPPGASGWVDYLTPSVNNATGVHCNIGAGLQSQAQLRCAQL